MQVDKAVFFSALITVAAFVPLFTMQGVEGQIFGPMARTYGYALAGALIATFTVTPVLASFFLPEHVKETETIVVRGLHRLLYPALRFALAHRRATVGRSALAFLAVAAFLGSRLGSEFLPPGGGQFLDSRLDAHDHVVGRRRSHAQDAGDLLSHPEVDHSCLPAWPARRWQRRLAVLQCRTLRAAQALRPMAHRT